MKSRVIFTSEIHKQIKKIAHEVSEDKISLYAAQASFFTITSAVPFISLMFAVVTALIPGNAADTAKNQMASLTISEGLTGILEYITDELSGAPNVSLLSLSAVTTLWSASRGIAAIKGGIESVYKAESGKNIFARRIKSITATLIFIAMITAIVSLLLFGNFISGFLGEGFSKLFMAARTPIFILTMTVMFTSIYCNVSKRSSVVKSSAVCHIPGAVFSSVGWIVFSFFYSLYIENFPSASYIYGGLAAVCLIMLWIYFCMMILLFGAVVNKLYFAGNRIK